MARNLRFDNQSVLLDAQELAVLRSPSGAGTNVALTLDNNSGLTSGDYVLLGEIGSGQTEIARINAAVTLGTAIQVGTLLFPHGIGTKITKLAYNQVKFFRATSVAGAKTELTTADIDADEEFTDYLDADNNTGYCFFALYNSATSAQSDYSSAFPYSIMTLATKSRIREFVKQWYKGALSEDAFDLALEIAESELFAVAPFRFRETTATFETVNGQATYLFSDLGITDFGILAYATYDGEPIDWATFNESRRANWNTQISAIVRIMHIWEETIEFTPAPDADDVEVKLWYWKNAAGFEEETTQTSTKLPQALAFRVLQDLWAMEDAKKSEYWERRYLQTVAALRRMDEKQVMRNAPLSDSGTMRRTANSQIENPTIEI